MRIVTRPDFDGVICAVLLHEAENITEPVKWVEPNDMQKQRVEIHPTDIIANLPYNENCRLWFDHHYTNRIDSSFTGAFRKAPSAARIIFEYYKDKFSRDFLPLVEAADRIDSAELTEDEVLHPEKYDAVILSLTISNQDEPDEAYWNRLVELLRGKEIQDVMSDPVVKKRCNDTVVQNKEYQGLLKEYTNVQGPVAVTDFRPMGKAPAGNRFLVYSLFPEAVVHARIRYDARDPDRIVVNVGHSIFNRNCRVNVGLLLSEFGGGGHPGAGSCRFPADKADEYLPRIIDSLVRNEPTGT
ncbi:MAG: exopolyphosphatase [Deltaproteobacteria bacterium SG8_13]|nr:MAG: exopolyphosphatase [Deltaproteobacteria bacterium SG8_13]